MLFAATVGEDDVKLFRYHVKEGGWKGQIVEIQVPNAITFEWTHSNLDRGCELGSQAAHKAIASYRSVEAVLSRAV